MSFHTLLGAFPIHADGDSLEPVPNDRVGELRGSSRSGAFARACSELLDVLPGHESLRFLANQDGPLSRLCPDPQTRWTVLDAQLSRRVLADLDSLLAACDHRVDAVASHVAFGSDRLNADEIRLALAAARESAHPNATTPAGDDGDTAEFVFAVLVSLRGLLRRARVESARVAIFTWAPA
jgi:hypothetical protein